MWKNYPIVPFGPEFGVVLAILIIWSLIWKGIALWKAAQNHHTVWYVIMLIVNTLGILEIIYIFGFSKKSAAPNPIR